MEVHTMEDYLTAVVFIFTMGGYTVYLINIFREETKNFLVIPWLLFTLLAYLDYDNILRSQERNWIELFAGGLIFLGPALISISIIISGWYIHASSEKYYILKKINYEFRAYPTQRYFLVIGLVLLVLLALFDGVVLFGSEYYLELVFALITITFDLIAIMGIRSEIMEKPHSFERVSWTLWIIALAITCIWNLSNGASLFSIGSILLLENFIVTLWILITIHVKQNM